jgi:hypothetical protein
MIYPAPEVMFIEFWLEDYSVWSTHYWNPLDPKHPSYKKVSANVLAGHTIVQEYKRKDTND